ncbi:protein of unknown function DUF330 [hydrothermal vent metagenome]|uniref:ABC-type transport auxiliary lipoprotein component domain-containing protein n=1 Tax=hydrothermal vent metagenome TaxID=652676 RepID=A0A1W1C0R0_9ZZZZ
MKYRLYILFISVGLLLIGCSSKSNFYQLYPKSAQNTNSTKSTKGTVIGIAEVKVAEYLTKSAIVTRMDASRVAIHETDLWAGSFAKNIQSVLTHNIASLLPRYTFLAYPWEEPIDDKYRIYITIDRFDGSQTGKVTLQGRWSVINKEENKVLYSESVNYTAQGGKTLGAIIDTQSKLLEQLSRRIAAKVRTRI